MIISEKSGLDLGLFQKDVAAQLGVNDETMFRWESNTSKPQVQFVPAVLNFLGYNPLHVARTFAERLVLARLSRGFSQKRMARWLGVDPGTLRQWEAGRRRPSRRQFELIQRALTGASLP